MKSSRQILSCFIFFFTSVQILFAGIATSAEPVCMGSIVRFTEQAVHKKNRILFANPHNPKNRERKNVTVKLSYDGDQTWPVAKSIESGMSGYSDLAVGPDGCAYCFYERASVDDSHYRPACLTLARFNLEWLTDGKDRFE